MREKFKRTDAKKRLSIFCWNCMMLVGSVISLLSEQQFGNVNLEYEL